MRISPVRLVATLVLSGQLLPVGLPLLCKQVQRRAPAGCEQQMASQTFGPAVAAATHSAPCVNAAFCAMSPTAALSLGGAVYVSAREYRIAGSGLSTLAPADPQPPLSPPPQA